MLATLIPVDTVIPLINGVLRRYWDLYSNSGEQTIESRLNLIRVSTGQRSDPLLFHLHEHRPNVRVPSGMETSWTRRLSRLVTTDLDSYTNLVYRGIQRLHPRHELDKVVWRPSPELHMFQA